MSVEWFSSDAQMTRADDWHRVIVYAHTDAQINDALMNLPHHFRIGVKPGAETAVWGPSRTDDGRRKVEIVGVVYRAFPASELENWLRTLTGDSALQIRMGYVTGVERIGYVGRGFAMGAVSSTTNVVSAVGGAASNLAGGAASLASGLGETAQHAGDVLPWLTILVTIGAIVLAIIALFTAPKWVPALLSG